MREAATTSGPLLLFDGDCGFCTRSVRWLDGKRLLGYPAVQWQSVPEDELPVPPARLMTEVVLTRAGLPPVGGADALAGAVAAGRSPWRFIGRLLRLPVIRNLARVVYRAVARNRYRMPGSTGACRIGD